MPAHAVYRRVTRGMVAPVVVPVVVMAMVVCLVVVLLVVVFYLRMSMSNSSATNPMQLAANMMKTVFWCVGMFLLLGH